MTSRRSKKTRISAPQRDGKGINALPNRGRAQPYDGQNNDIGFAGAVVFDDVHAAIDAGHDERCGCNGWLAASRPRTMRKSALFTFGVGRDAHELRRRGGVA